MLARRGWSLRTNVLRLWINGVVSAICHHIHPLFLHGLWTRGNQLFCHLFGEHQFFILLKCCARSWKGPPSWSLLRQPPQLSDTNYGEDFWCDDWHMQALSTSSSSGKGTVNSSWKHEKEERKASRDRGGPVTSPCLYSTMHVFIIIIRIRVLWRESHSMTLPHFYLQQLRLIKQVQYLSTLFYYPSTCASFFFHTHNMPKKNHITSQRVPAYNVFFFALRVLHFYCVLAGTIRPSHTIFCGKEKVLSLVACQRMKLPCWSDCILKSRCNLIFRYHRYLQRSLYFVSISEMVVWTVVISTYVLMYQEQSIADRQRRIKPFRIIAACNPWSPDN